MKRNLGLMIFLVLIPLVFLSCNESNLSEDSLPEIGPITIGYLPASGYAGFFLAHEKGYFEEQGLQVELQNFGSASYMMPLLATGDLDIGTGQAGTELFNAAHQKLDVKISGGMAQHREGNGAFSLLVRKDLFDSGVISEPGDFKGRKVAINVERGLFEVFLAKVLSTGNLTLDDIEIVTLPFSDVNVAFANQAIDAAFMIEPLATFAVKEGIAVRYLTSDKIFDHPQISLIYFGKRLLEPENKEIGTRFYIAYLKAVREINSQTEYTEEIYNLINQYTQIPSETIRNSIQPYLVPNGELNLSFLEYVMNYYIDNGYTEMTSPIPVNQMIDSSYLDEALERIGIYEE